MDIEKRISNITRGIAEYQVRQETSQAIAALVREAVEEQCCPLDDALISCMQTGVGETMHPDATALVFIAFRTGKGALQFQDWYVRQRRARNAQPADPEGPG